MAEPLRLALVRHGQTDWNVAGRMQGRTDIPLNAQGRAQARALAARLADAPAWDAIVTSPLQRASDTAEILAAALGTGSPIPCAGLAERTFGDAEGLSPDAAVRRWPDRVYPGMEFHDAVVDRGLAALERIAARFPSGRVIAVSHGSFIRHLLAALAGRPSDAMPRIGNAEASRLERSSDGRWRILDISGIPCDRDDTFRSADSGVAGSP